MMKTELERSYIFESDSLSNILTFLKVNTCGYPIDINDVYLNKNLRIRTCENKTIVTRKTGDKGSGHRIEDECQLTKNVSPIFTKDSELTVIKKRYKIDNVSDDFDITLDIVGLPMKIAILEIESTTNTIPPTAYQIFGKDLIECPLSAWDLFKQKIGICGAPSCGKTETAKTLSGLLSTNFRANAFHVTEYSTSFIQKYNRHPNTMDQFMMWYCQRSREEDAMSKANIVISDCPTFLSYIYMLFNNKDKMNDQFRIHLVKLYKRVLEDVDHYSKIIYLRPHDLNNNNIRFHTSDEIRQIANLIHSFLKCHNIPHMVADRTDMQKIINNLFYFNTIPEEGTKP